MTTSNPPQVRSRSQETWRMVGIVLAITVAILGLAFLAFVVLVYISISQNGVMGNK